MDFLAKVCMILLVLSPMVVSILVVIWARPEAGRFIFLRKKIILRLFSKATYMFTSVFFSVLFLVGEC